MDYDSIPYGDQFSPTQIDLIKVLIIINKYSGNYQRIKTEIFNNFFSDHHDPEQILAYNTIKSLTAYKLLNKENQPTDFAVKLMATSSEEELYRLFASHIIKNIGGILLIDAVRTMKKSGIKITLNTIEEHLHQRGCHLPRGSSQISSMRLWLAKAGIFGEKRNKMYEIDEARLNDILGVSLDVIDILSDLSEQQRTFLMALKNFPEKGPFISNKIADFSTTLYNTKYNHKEVAKLVVYPLAELGYIEYIKTTRGKGSKSPLINKTEKFDIEITNPNLLASEWLSKLVPKEFFELKLSDIVANLKSDDKNIKGKALEFLVFYLTRLLDLEFKSWRKRDVNTGGAEVDAIIEGSRLIFSRWQVQAKNTDKVDLEDIAKEVGLSLTFIYSNVIMAVTTGSFTRDAYRYSSNVMKKTNLNIILLDGDELEAICNDPTDLAIFLNEKAKNVMKIKDLYDR